MLKCEKCGNKFKFKQLLWSSWYAPIICKKCGTNHYVCHSSKVIYWIILILMLVVINFDLLGFAGRIGSIVLSILLGIVFISILPFLMRLYTKKEDNESID
jgi:CXXC-20-CXXC protein